jgi:hypothetical protein
MQLWTLLEYDAESVSVFRKSSLNRGKSTEERLSRLSSGSRGLVPSTDGTNPAQFRTAQG